jgi:hypothetical protein
MAREIKITVDAAQYQDSDDCLAAAAADMAAERGLEGWDLAPRWADSERTRIELTVPDRTADMCAALVDLDDGTGDLGVIVRQALADDPDATVQDIREIVAEAREEAEQADSPLS